MTMFGTSAGAQEPGDSTRTLVVCFSRRGNNYLDGKIVFLEEGNTEVVARKICELTGADLFRIEPEKPYPDDYYETTRVAREELAASARPAIRGELPRTECYDVIYLGYPNWWGTMPMAVFTFLERCNLGGKTIVPFCTHEGSGMGRSEADLKAACPGATVLKGLPLRGGRVRTSDRQIAEWVERTAAAR